MAEDPTFLTKVGTELSTLIDTLKRSEQDARASADDIGARLAKELTAAREHAQSLLDQVALRASDTAGSVRDDIAALGTSYDSAIDQLQGGVAAGTEAVRKESASLRSKQQEVLVDLQGRAATAQEATRELVDALGRSASAAVETAKTTQEQTKQQLAGLQEKSEKAWVEVTAGMRRAKDDLAAAAERARTRIKH